MKTCMVCGCVVKEEKYLKGFRDGKEFEWEEIFCRWECYEVHCRRNNWEHYDQMAALAKEERLQGKALAE